MGLNASGEDGAQRFLESLNRDNAAFWRRELFIVLDIACGDPPPDFHYSAEEAQEWLTAPGYDWFRRRLVELSGFGAATVAAMIEGRRADGWRLPPAPPSP